jgi:hypothetical protein
MTRLFRPGGKLEDALVGKEVDVGHPLVVAYLETHAAAKENLVKSKPPEKIEPTPAPERVAKPVPTPPKTAGAIPAPPLVEDTPPLAMVGDDDDRAAPMPGHQVLPEMDGAPPVEELLEMPLRDILARYGTLPRFVSYLDAVKKMEEIDHRRTMTQERRGDLVNRHLMAAAFTAVVEQAFKRLVTDIPEGVAVDVVARAQSGGPDARIDVLEIIRGANAKALKSCKAKVLENASG